VKLVDRLFDNDPLMLSLLGDNPFADAPPRWIRIEAYRYRFAPWDDPSGAWWRRERLGDWLLPIQKDDPRVRRFLEGGP
jgi:hypothetical protein